MAICSLTLRLFDVFLVFFCFQFLLHVTVPPISSLSPSSAAAAAVTVEFLPKTPYKQKQNETLSEIF
jgi:hypothetical protein